MDQPRRTKQFRLVRGLAPLGHRDYLLYLIGNGSSSIGSQAEIVAAAWLLYHLTNSPVLLGVGGLFSALPIFLLVPYAGTMADRVSPRRLLAATQTTAFLNSLALGFLVALGWVQAWHVYLQVLLQASVSAFDVTARQALFPRLIPRDKLDQAVTMNFTVVRIAMFSGPWIGGMTIAEFGLAVPFFFNAASYLAMLVAVITIREPARNPKLDATRSVRQDLFQGWAFVRQSEVIFTLLLFAGLWGILSTNTTVLTIYARDVLDVGPKGLGLLLSSGAAGQLAGSLVLVCYGEVRRKGPLLFGIAALYTLATIAFSFSRLLALSAALLIVSGMAHAIFSATRHTILQRVAPDTMRGRVMGTHLIVTRGVSPLSQTVSGVMVDLLGPTGALLGAALALGGATAGVAVCSPALRAFGSIHASAGGAFGAGKSDPP